EPTPGHGPVGGKPARGDEPGRGVGSGTPTHEVVIRRGRVPTLPTDDGTREAPTPIHTCEGGVRSPDAPRGCAYPSRSAGWPAGACAATHPLTALISRTGRWPMSERLRMTSQ